MGKHYDDVERCIKFEYEAYNKYVYNSNQFKLPKYIAIGHNVLTREI